MKKKLISSVILLILIFQNLLVLSPFFDVEATTTNNPSKIELELRKNDSGVMSEDGIAMYTIGDIVSLDLYIATPNANITECLFSIQGPYMKERVKVKNIEINQNLSEDIKNCIEVSMNKNTNDAYFEFDGTESNTNLTSSTEMKLATITFDVIDYVYELDDNNNRNLEELTIGVGCSKLKRGTTLLGYLVSSYKLYATKVPTSITTECKKNILVGEEATITSTVYSEELTCQKVTYSSSNSNIVKVYSDGTIRGMVPGFANITVSSSIKPSVTTEFIVTVSERTSSNPITSIEVTNKPSSMNIGDSLALQTAFTPTNTDDYTLRYESSDPSVASIDTNGNIEALKDGTTTITVYSINNKVDSFELTVTNPVTGINIINPVGALQLGDRYSIKVLAEPLIKYDKLVQYSSSNPEVATISQGGCYYEYSFGSIEVSTSQPGTTKITAYVGDVEESFYLNVLPTNSYVAATAFEIANKKSALKLGDTYTLQASITPSNASNKLIKFFSSDESIATIDSDGKITSLSYGTTTISAAYGGFTDSFDLTVNENGEEIPITSMEIYYGDESNLKLPPDSFLSIGVKVTPENATEEINAIYTSSDESVATIDSDGLIYTIKEGTTIITAKVEDFTDSFLLTIANEDEGGDGGNEEETPETPVTPTEPKIVAYYTVNENITATLDENGLLKITGTGNMPDYEDGKAPWYSSASSIKKVVVEDGVTSLGKLALQDCSFLTSLDLGTTLTKIGEGAFYNCSSLETFTAPSSLTTIDEGAFAYCSSLKEINLNEGLTTIGRYAFQDTIIETLTIPSTVTEISSEFCWGVESIKEYIVKEGNTEFYTHEGVLYNTPSGLKNNDLLAYPVGSERTEYTVPDGVTRIEQSAFLNAINLQKVNLPDSIFVYGAYAFKGSGLTSLVVPASNLKSLSSNVWSDCPNLKTVEFKANTTECIFGDKLPGSIFENCTVLENVIISGNVKEIYAGAFENCTNLKKVEFTGNTETINYFSFEGCTSLEEIVWPSTLIEVSKSAFKGCDKLTEKYPQDFVLYDDGYYRLPPTDITITGDFDYQKAKEVLDIVNEERENAGLEPLAMDEELFKVANQRAAEIAVRYSHTRPDGSDCSSIFPEVDYSQITGTGVTVHSAENIAAGSISAEDVMERWMNSAGHKSNILTEGFKYIGIGCFYHNGTYYWVQCFFITGNEMTEYPTNETKQMTIPVLMPKIELSFNTSTLNLSVGNSSNVTVYGYYSLSEWHRKFIIDADNLNLEMADQSIATYNNGTITALKDNSNTTFTAKLKEDTSISATLDINIKTFCTSIYVPEDFFVITKDTPISSLGIYAEPFNATDRNLTYSILDTSVATINNDTIVPLRNTVTHLVIKTNDGSNITRRVPILVDMPIKATGLTLNTNNINITSSTESRKITSTVTPTSTTNKSVTYTSGDTNIATVDSNGYVRGVSNGTTYINVSTTDGSNLTSTVWVTVNIPVEQPVEPPFQLPFKDIRESDWCYEAVKYVYQRRYILGTSPTTYEPGTKLTRGMIVTILHRMEGENKVGGEMKFPDVPSTEYYYEAVKWASANKIVNGYGDGTFKPNKAVTREELAVILRNYTRDYKGENTDSITADLNRFNDGNKVSDYAVSAVQWAVGSGVITGYSHNNTVAPQGTATRDVAASMLFKYCNRIK